MGHFGNGASVQDLARIAGISEGSVEWYTQCCQQALLAHHDWFVRMLTPEEKEVEKRWIEEQSSCLGWQEGDAYWHQKCNYGINAQIGNVPSSLCIVDYSYGMTASAHDAAAFEHTRAAKYPEFFFQGNEFAWADSVYACTTQMIPVHKKPKSEEPCNAAFDKNCIGALNGHWQCLHGLRVAINSKHEHVLACKWITVAIILHNMLIDWKGKEWINFWKRQHNPEEEPAGDEGGAKGMLDKVL
ncbi:hypothetical protein K439DRAFT_1649067 [Ramaria rubella]|nr:hypothetical protein K439DRAFT_1649067 [Ramaria rubella]